MAKVLGVACVDLFPLNVAVFVPSNRQPEGCDQEYCVFVVEGMLIDACKHFSGFEMTDYVGLVNCNLVPDDDLEL